MTAAKKINTVTKSNPAAIFFSATPRRAAGLRGCRRGSNFEDRNFYYGLDDGRDSLYHGRPLPVPKIAMLGRFCNTSATGAVAAS
jgi:hypothetical protein